MDPALRAQLILQCWPNFTDPESRVYLDQYTWMAFDNEFYNQIRLKRGVLYIDQQLALDPLSKGLVYTFVGDDVLFKRNFSDAIVKMGSIKVLVGEVGEIRRNWILI
ncbi:hypothetical protein JHK85_006149 [Glycine max]|nr:hypothetical protein JHK85_006149 [Glycine max]KAG5070779.1 hypothetical protein JHK86_005990 [Glycine max]